MQSAEQTEARWLLTLLIFPNYWPDIQVLYPNAADIAASIRLLCRSDACDWVESSRDMNAYVRTGIPYPYRSAFPGQRRQKIKVEKIS